MAKLEKKNINPLVAALANFCCLSFLGYVLIGQTNKSIYFLAASLALAVIGALGSPTVIIPILIGPVYLALAVLVALDVHSLATAVAAGEEVDENEYRIEILYKVAAPVHKNAVYRGVSASPPPPPADDKGGA